MCCRREREDGDQVPLFAPSEGESPWMVRGGEDRATYLVKTLSPEGDDLDTTTLDAATDLLEGLIDDMSATEASDLMQGDESVDENVGGNKENISTSDREEARFNAVPPPDSHQVCEMQKQSPHAGPLLGSNFLFGSNFILRSKKLFASLIILSLLKERLLNPKICRLLEQRETSLKNLQSSLRHLIGL